MLAHLRTRGRGVLAVLITVGVEDHLNTVACAAETQGARMVYVQRAVGSNVAQPRMGSGDPPTTKR